MTRAALARFAAALTSVTSVIFVAGKPLISVRLRMMASSLAK